MQMNQAIDIVMKDLRAVTCRPRRFHPASPILTLSLVLAGCAAPNRPGADVQAPSPLIVSTSTGQGWRHEPPPPKTTPVARRRPTEPTPDRATRQPAASSGAPSTGNTADGDITLNFVDADLQGVIRALARFTGRNFLVDPRVKGKL